MKETNPLPYRRAAQSLEKELHFCCKERATCQPAAQGQVLSLDLLGLDTERQPQASAFPAAAMGDGGRPTLLSPWCMPPMASRCAGG